MELCGTSSLDLPLCTLAQEQLQSDLQATQDVCTTNGVLLVLHCQYKVSLEIIVKERGEGSLLL